METARRRVKQVRPNERSPSLDSLLNPDQLTDFLENAAMALHVVGAEGTILWANAAELKLLGYTADEYIGRNIKEFHLDAPAIEDILLRLKEGEELHEYEARLRARDGSVRYVAITSKGYSDEGRASIPGVSLATSRTKSARPNFRSGLQLSSSRRMMRSSARI